MELFTIWSLIPYIFLTVYFAVIASERGQSGFGIFMLGAFFSPILSGFVLIVSRPTDAIIERHQAMMNQPVQYEALPAHIVS